MLNVKDLSRLMSSPSFEIRFRMYLLESKYLCHVCTSLDRHVLLCYYILGRAGSFTILKLCLVIFLMSTENEI